jgi:dTDP-4-dehydrorhamnose reductase
MSQHDRCAGGAEPPARSGAPLEMWAGVECTVNRVDDRYFDQVERTGHAARLDDLERIAALGVRAVRYPVLWERVAPDGLERADWHWVDARLHRLRELGVRPIVGLVHHGSGPRGTSLVDPAFPIKLAAFARAVAERYPWVEHFTPVNEPLTTARFSALYGVWYPHARDALTFARSLLTQCAAIVRAMEAIREVTPAARLVQTEDLAKVHSTPLLRYQADFENDRRWLSFDLLCGRVVPGHRAWRYLHRGLGIPERELAWFAARPCPPDILGLNHYVTSERFLDERLERYPPHTHGGNGRHAYADVEAVRVCADGPAGPRALLREAWERYRLPMAITEVHLGCTREQQLRWLAEVWQAAGALRAEGVELRAVTAWSLLGAFDWNSLLTRDDGCYESGAFDVRAPEPRPTAVARMIRALATDGAYAHPVLDEAGWWKQPSRLLYPPVVRECARARSTRWVRPWGVHADEQGRQACGEERGEERHQLAARRADAAHAALHTPPRPRPILITGATGTLGAAFARLCAERGLAHRLTSRRELDIADPTSVAGALDAHRPWAVVNAAGYVRVDDAERDQQRCFRENAVGPALLAEQCADRGVALLTFSSDLVFDGRQEIPYTESSVPAPLNAYGASKAEGERLVLAAMPGAMVVRTSAFFGPWDQHNFVAAVLRSLAAGVPFAAADDAVVAPTYVPDLVHASLDLLIDGERGIWHLANAGSTTWAALAVRVAEIAGLDPALVEARPVAELGLAAARPRYSVLASERAALLPAVENAICRCIAARPPDVGFTRHPLQFRHGPPSAGGVGAVA